jgi:hypothetical protein
MMTKILKNREMMIKTTIEKHAMLVIDLVDINDYTVGKHAQNNSNKNKDFTIL